MWIGIAVSQVWLYCTNALCDSSFVRRSVVKSSEAR